jgi:hypothetical protein
LVVSAPLTLESNRYNGTRAIVRDGQRVGFLYRPTSPGDAWEIWPSYQTPHPLLDTGTALFVSFATEADALAFLNIPQPEDFAA